jgi:hypothetical protein
MKMTEPTNSDIMHAIGGLEEGVKGIKENMSSHSDRMDSHSKRIGSVENKQAWYAGAAVAGGSLGAMLLKKMGLL